MTSNPSPQHNPFQDASASPPQQQFVPIYITAPAQKSAVGGLFHSFSMMVSGGLTVAALIFGFSVWRSSTTLVDRVKTTFTQPQPSPQVDIRSVVVQQVRGASELTSAIFAMEAVVPTSRDRTFAGYTIGRTTLLYIAYGEVRAGIDLSQIQPEDLQTVGDVTILRLPPPQILDSKIDVTRSEVYDYDRGMLGIGPDSAAELQDLAQRQALQEIVSVACDRGILEEANRRAETAIAQLVSPLGNVRVETQPVPLDACVPPVQPPANGSDNSANGAASPADAAGDAALNDSANDSVNSAESGAANDSSLQPQDESGLESDRLLN